jgi:hypothetical protein
MRYNLDSADEKPLLVVIGFVFCRVGRQVGQLVGVWVDVR